MRTKLLLLLAMTLTSCQAQRQQPERLVRTVTRGTRGAVGAGTEQAVEAGMRLFHKGGNAVDAGVAAMFAAAVVEYSHFGWGGEAPILVRARDGKVWSIAGVGTMPKLATAEMFRKRPLKPGEFENVEPNGLPGMIPTVGLMPALVPGMPDAGLVALKHFGTLSFSEIIGPAVDLADGAAIDEMRSNYIRGSREFFEMWPTSLAVFVPGGRAPLPGQVFRQPDLARTLRSLVEAERRALSRGAKRDEALDAVRDHFYRGDIARRIGAFSEANGGLLRYEDMAAFRSEPEEPVSTSYRGTQVYKPGFWSQGPTFLETLNLLEHYNLPTLGYNTAEYVHVLAEAVKLAYADRDTYYGDPKFVKIPAEVLLSKEYAALRKGEIGARASSEFRPGAIAGVPGAHPSQADIVVRKIDDALMAKDTTCVNVMDRDGVMFSATPSGAWLPSVIAGDTGIPLTQRAQSFLLVPGHPNELAGGKRPRVTLSPTIVTRDGKPYLAFSTPGGDNQEQALLQVFLAVHEFGMNPQAAVEAGRFQTRHLVSSFDNHAMSRGDLRVDDRLGAAVLRELAERGHRVTPHNRYGGESAPVLIRLTPGGVFEAGADPYRARYASAW